MNITQIPVSSIQTHWELNRFPNKHHVHALARHMNEKGFDKQFPLRVIRIESDFHLAAGHHRYDAATLEDILYPNLPLAEVWVEVSDGTIDDVIRILQEDNFQHDPGVNPELGLPLSGDEKRQQCQTLMRFPDIFKQTDVQLGKLWGVHRTTIGNWREKIECDIHTLSKRNLSADELLVDFSITPARLTEMLHLIESGEREITQRRRDGTTQTTTVKTAASAEKKQDAKAEAIKAFREQSGLVMAGLQNVAVKCHSLTRQTIKRRLWDAYDLDHAANASKWPLKRITSETTRYEALLVELRDAASPWREEFHKLHHIEVNAKTLRDMGGPYETAADAVKQVLAEASRLHTADFENLEQKHRMNILRQLFPKISDILQTEQTARAAAEKARKLKVAISGAQAACRRLHEMFIVSRFEDTSELGYQAFLSAACREGQYSSKSLSVKMFIAPQDFRTEEQGHRIRSIADRIRVDLGTAEPPAWIASRLPAPEPAPAPTPPPAPAPETPAPEETQTTDNTPVIDPRYAELSKKGISVVWETSSKSPSGKWGLWRILDKKRKNVEVHRQFGHKEVEEEILARAQEIAAATESFARPELTPTEPAIDTDAIRQIRDAANAMGAVLSIEKRALPSTVANLDTRLSEQCPDHEEALDALRQLILRRLGKAK